MFFERERERGERERKFRDGKRERERGSYRERDTLQRKKESRFV